MIEIDNSLKNRRNWLILQQSCGAPGGMARVETDRAAHGKGAAFLIITDVALKGLDITRKGEPVWLGQREGKQPMTGKY